MVKHKIWVENESGQFTLVKEYVPKKRVKFKKKFVTFFPDNKYLAKLDSTSFQRTIILTNFLQKYENVLVKTDGVTPMDTESISKKLNISIRSTQMLIKTLIEFNVLAKNEKGHFLFNPNICIYGTSKNEELKKYFI